MQDKFNTLIDKYELRLKKQNSIFILVGNVKLTLVLLIGALLYLVFSKGFLIEFIIAGIIALSVLILLCIYHNDLNDKMNYSKGIVSINKRHLERVSGQWVSFADIGEEFIEIEHAYACDLDIVGKKSLFQFLNTTNTWHGRKAFVNDLLRPSYSINELKARQKAVLELSKDLDFSNHIQYLLSKIGVHNSEQELVSELKNKQPFIKNKGIKAFLTFLPLLTVIVVAGVAIFQAKNFYLIGVILAFFQTMLWVIGLPKTSKYLGIMAHLTYKLNAYETVIESLKNRSFDSEVLLLIQKKINVSAQAMKDLAKISTKLSVRHNGLVYLIFNILFLWDFECAFTLEEWKNKYADFVEEWFLSLGEFESLLCFSHLANVCSETSIPSISDFTKEIHAKSIGHPLLTNGTRVSNDISCRGNIFIISGSNMSGKTTFLRTVGVNLVLASAGGFVCANQLIFSPTKIMTSMRISDDLSEGVSTFYAELKRIKAIIELAKEKSDMIFLIDEIFRGTNSVDRLFGAKTVIAKLNEFGVIGIISTHDLELCELEHQYSRIVNYSFSENYKNNTIIFDYRMKSGKSKTTNAQFLMEKIGII